MSLIKRIAISQGNAQAKDRATVLLATIDQKKMVDWNKALVEEIKWKAQDQVFAKNNRSWQ